MQIFSLNLTYTKIQLMLLLNSNCKTIRKISVVALWFLLLLVLSFKNKISSKKIESDLCGSCKISYTLFDDFKIKDVSYLDSCIIYIESKKYDYRETINLTLSNSVNIFNSDFLKNRIITLKGTGYGLYLTSPFLHKRFNNIKYLYIVNYKENLKSFIISFITMINKNQSLSITFIFENKSYTRVIKEINTFMTNLYIK